MSDQPAQSSPRSAPRGSPSDTKYTPIAITIVVAVVLAFGSCFGFLGTMGRVPWFSNLLGIVFITCALTFVGAIVWLIVRVVIDIVHR